MRTNELRMCERKNFASSAYNVPGCETVVIGSESGGKSRVDGDDQHPSSSSSLTTCSTEPSAALPPKLKHTATFDTSSA
ncbi:hypothetical protein B0H12DRAFT_1240112 [Mycena haematopus]|nr:hypothetical protein B0H12DRAFT_1240112 [Mycena haematopus]